MADNRNEIAIRFGTLIGFSLLIIVVMLPREMFISYLGIRPEDLVSVCALGWFITLFRLNTGRHVQLVMLLVFVYACFRMSQALFSKHYPGAMALIALKETTYFAFFFVGISLVYGPFQIRLLKDISTVALFVFGMHLIWQLIFVEYRGLYGYSPIGYGLSPLASSAIFLLFLVIACWHYFLILDRSMRVKLHIFMFWIFLILAGSKTIILLSTVFLMTLLYQQKNIFYFFVFILITIGSLILAFDAPGVSFLGVDRLWGFTRPLDTLIERGIWHKLNFIQGFEDILFGVDQSKFFVSSDLRLDFTMAMDNGFLWNILVVGLIGSILYGGVLVEIYRGLSLTSSVALSQRKKYFFFALTLGYLFGSLGAEVLVLSLSGICFWLAMGMVYGVSDEF